MTIEKKQVLASYAALETARRMAGFTRRAGLGPWAQLTDEGMALQILGDMGRNEEVPGVKFRQLFDRLPRRAADGDAALAEVWKLAASVEPSAGPDMTRVLRDFAPLLRGIAAVARGDDSPRAQIEAALPQLEENGWRLTDAVHWVWDGERDVEALCADIDPNSARLVERILELIELPSPQEVLAGAPEAVREAIAAKDAEALGVALGAMPAGEAEALVERLRAVGVLR